jgi:hypothetical protein
MFVQPHSSFFYNGSSLESVFPAETTYSAFAPQGSSLTMQQSHDRGTSYNQFSVFDDFYGSIPVPGPSQPYYVGSSATAQLCAPSVFPFEELEGGTDVIGSQRLEENMGFTGIAQPDFQRSANMGVGFPFVNSDSRPSRAQFHQAMQMRNQSCHDIAIGYHGSRQLGQSASNECMELNGLAILSSARSFASPDDGWSDCTANAQQTVGYEEMIKGHLGFIPSGNIGSEFPVSVNPQAKSAAASFDMRPTVSKLRSLRSSKPQSTVASTVRTSTRTELSSISRRTEASRPPRPPARNTGSPHLFRDSMIQHLPPNSIFVFEQDHLCISSCVPPSHEGSSFCYVMRLGNSKVSAIDRISDMVLNPTAPESTSIYVKAILKETVRWAQKTRHAHYVSSTSKPQPQGAALGYGAKTGC